MPNIGFWEIAIVVVIALLVFGPKKLPELGSSIGRSINGFRRSLRETEEEVQTAVRQDAATGKEAPAPAVTIAATTEVASEAGAGVKAEHTDKS